MISISAVCFLAGRRKAAHDPLRLGDKPIGTVRALLAAEANLHAMHDSALWQAAGNGHTDTVWVLLEAGADTHARNGAALRLAMIGGHSRTALFLSEWTHENGHQPA